MNIVSKRKKGLIGLSVAVAVLVMFVGIQGLAAGRVDLDKDVTITAKIDTNDNSLFVQKYKGNVEVKVFKLATMDAFGNLTVTSDFAGAGLDLSVLGNEPTVDDIKAGIVDNAVATAKNITDSAKYKTITIDRAIGKTSGYTKIQKGAGLYLYMPEDVTDDEYVYSFTPYVIMAPSSERIVTGQGSDEWKYDVSFNLKSSEERRFGTLKLTKTLDKYNESLGFVSFVYKIKATLSDGTVVFDDLRTIDFSAPGTKEVEVEIPATAIVTVEEVYTGGSYQAVEGTNTKYENIKIVVDEEKEVKFENTYDGNLITGNMSAVNTYEKVDGEYVHTNFLTIQ
ncbi:hypothetical protein [Pseudobutyrivibrio ruminis]|uniref:hypothetical protein n=1 Tax=Pseudobutyrivibrio ruminis TaxID=46206 RepID=UPI000405C2E9|nr:hypothetical protein [Pseudobutyrivibrio ruminis]